MFARILCWVLLIQVINISIDPVDPLPIRDSQGQLTGNEDLSINDIESIYELVSEQCLNVDVPEHDEDDESGFVKVFDFYFSDSSITIKPNYTEAKPPHTLLTHGFASVSIEHTSPPPRLA